MKKTALILLLIILCAMIIGYSTNGYNYADSGRYTSGGGRVSGNVEDVEINWVDGRVSIAYHQGDEIILSETSPKDLAKKEELHWLLDGEKLYVQYAGANVRRLNGLDKELTVLLPEKLQLKNVHIVVVSAVLEAEDIVADSVEINSVSGIVNMMGKRVRELEATTVSGGLTLRFSQTPENIDVESVSGDVCIMLPEDAGVKAEVKSVSGMFGGSLPMEKRGNDLYSCGDEHCAIDVDTVSGSVRLDVLK